MEVCLKQFLYTLESPAMLIEESGEISFYNKGLLKILPEVEKQSNFFELIKLNGLKNWNPNSEEYFFNDGKSQNWKVVSKRVSSGFFLQFIAELEVNQQQFLALIETLPGFVSWIDEDLKYIGVNGKLAEKLNMRPNEIIGNKVGHLQTYHGIAMKELLIKFKESKIDHLTVESSVDENRSMILLMSFHKYNNNKNIVIVALDITEQKKNQEQIYEQEIQLRTKSKLSALGELSTQIAHEINGPLNIINECSLRLQKTTKDEKNLKLVNKIHTMGDRIIRISEGLKKFVHKEDIHHKRNHNLKKIIDEAYEISSLRAKSKDVLLSVSCPEDIFFLCDEISFSQVIINFLNNGCDAVESKEDRWVKLFVEKNETLKINIVDSGSGIPKDLRDKIFLPFFSTKAPGKGTGIGLDVSQKIVNEHGGVIRINTKSTNTHFVLEFSGV